MPYKESITREKLYELVWEYPIKYFTEKYLVSNSSFKKICLNHNIPIPHQGYWSKKKFGKNEKTSLEKVNNEQEIILYQRLEGDKRDFGVLTDLDKKTIEIEEDAKVNFSIPEKLSGRIHPIVGETKKYLKGQVQIPQDIGYYDRYYPGPFRCYVSKNELSRAFKIITILIRNLRARGHELTFGRYGSFIKSKGIEIEIQLSEKNRRVKYQDKYGENYRSEPTGNLVIQAGPNYNNKTWHDAKSIKLEEKVSSIIAWFEIKIEEKHLWKIAQEKREAERKEEERLQKLKQELINNEIKVFNDLYSESELWHKAKKFREYLREYEQSLSETNNLTQEKIKLLQFGFEKANWLDPLVESQDELFKNLDPNGLKFL